MKAKMTVPFLDRLKKTGKARERYFDSPGDPKGFFVRILPGGQLSFGVMFGPKGSRKQITIGNFGEMTLGEAREKANEYRASYRLGDDPGKKRAQQRKAGTFKDWAADYIKDVKKRKRSWKTDERFLLWAARSIGTTPLGAVTSEDITRLVALVRDRGIASPLSTLTTQRARTSARKAQERWKNTGPRTTQANRFLASMRACLASAWRLGRIAENPALRVRAFSENAPRARVLSDEELASVLKVVNDHPDPFLKVAFNLIIETGCRKSEVLRAKWEDVDLKTGRLRLPKTKSGKPQVVPLSGHLIEELRGLPRHKDSPWLIPSSTKPAQHRSDPLKEWRIICGKAKVEGVTIHDLRRTYGLEVAMTAGIHAASKLLRHSNIAVTSKIYAPFGVDLLKQTSEKVAKKRERRLRLVEAKQEAK